MLYGANNSQVTPCGLSQMLEMTPETIKDTNSLQRGSAEYPMTLENPK